MNSHCRLSLTTLKQMQENHEEFYTVARHKKLLIADVNENSQKIKMERSTGKITWSLDYQKLKEVHDLIHHGELMLDHNEVGKKVVTWGSYVTALSNHLGHSKSRIAT